MCFRSRITHKCNDGRVFSDKFKASKVNTCTGTSDGAKWEYDIDNKLPMCIRKSHFFIFEIKSISNCQITFTAYCTEKLPKQPSNTKKAITTEKGNIIGQKVTYQCKVGRNKISKSLLNY